MKRKQMLRSEAYDYEAHVTSEAYEERGVARRQAQRMSQAKHITDGASVASV